MSEWQRMKTAPRDGTTILALYDNNLFYEHVLVKWTAKNQPYPWANSDDTNAYPDGRLAFWQPLPEPPE